MYRTFGDLEPGESIFVINLNKKSEFQVKEVAVVKNDPTSDMIACNSLVRNVVGFIDLPKTEYILKCSDVIYTSEEEIYTFYKTYIENEDNRGILEILQI